ncbi:photosynthetic complex putative assembly protein PuhB [uncultured Pseudacidovorax sp.]|uniref:photosynthetic complex putative assembly protein PuhB n=1 Tax=uncultured Pseudacidovorax sp. TaxID=679313 RepID=UPI0025F44CFA|nr:photosynthetic complex putative assembly protein PuhB [uncultured Pseudacidovorax sp.]
MKAINRLAPAHEHEFEARHGLPEALPQGERLLWQGSPSAALVAVQALHIRKVAAYFALLLGWRLASDLHDGAGWAAALAGCAGMLAPIVLALGLIGAMAWLVARTSVYTLTDRRVVMRIGVVLSITFNLPLARIASADLRQRRHSADIALTLAGDERIAYPHLWPHARPWQLRSPQPMLRALPAAEAAALSALLAPALRQAHATPGADAAVKPAAGSAHPLPQRAVRAVQTVQAVPPVRTHEAAPEAAHAGA